jgi:hypothetical protein
VSDEKGIEIEYLVLLSFQVNFERHIAWTRWPDVDISIYWLNNKVCCYLCWQFEIKNSYAEQEEARIYAHKEVFVIRHERNFRIKDIAQRLKRDSTLYKEEFLVLGENESTTESDVSKL